MLAKANRLNRADFSKYFKCGQRKHSANFTIVFTRQDHNQASVVVSKKVSKKAVVRNQLKRVVYSQIFEFFKNNPDAGVLIVVLKVGVVSLSRAQFRESLQIELGRLLK